MMRTLLVTNDFPPRKGGIQTYLEGFARELDPDSLVVYCSTPEDPSEYDAKQPWTTLRFPGAILLPTPGVRKQMQQIIRDYDIEAVWFGSSTPLGLMAKAAREAGATRIVSTTHGHEIGWSMIPGGSFLLRRIFSQADVVTYLTEATLRRLRPFTGDTQLVRMPGGIQPENFAFSQSHRMMLRRRYGIGPDDPTVICISRLVERKGQDTLISAWPDIIDKHPRAKLVIVGTGPYEGHLHRLAQSSPARDSIIFTGEVPHAELSSHYSLGDIFAMPCRTRGKGLDIEGLGIVYLEAYAAGLPVVSGDSGGAPEAVIHGKTGLITRGSTSYACVGALTYLLDNPERAKEMGQAGNSWVDTHWRWARLARPLLEIFS